MQVNNVLLDVVFNFVILFSMWENKLYNQRFSNNYN